MRDIFLFPKTHKKVGNFLLQQHEIIYIDLAKLLFIPLHPVFLSGESTLQVMP